MKKGAFDLACPYLETTEFDNYYGLVRGMIPDMWLPVKSLKEKGLYQWIEKNIYYEAFLDVESYQSVGTGPCVYYENNGNQLVRAPCEEIHWNICVWDKYDLFNSFCEDFNKICSLSINVADKNCHCFSKYTNDNFCRYVIYLNALNKNLAKYFNNEKTSIETILIT